MTETPKCPYCGAEMKLHRCNSSIRLWYECNCGSESPHISPNWAKDTEESWLESTLSAALHRADPELRPLTLEELKAHCAKGWDAEPLWVEYDTVRDMALWVLANVPCGMDEKDMPSLTYWLKDEELVSEYGKFWRCWTQKPTPEQMAAEKWED